MTPMNAKPVSIATYRAHRLAFDACGGLQWGGHQTRPYIMATHSDHWFGGTRTSGAGAAGSARRRARRLRSPSGFSPIVRSTCDLRP